VSAARFSRGAWRTCCHQTHGTEQHGGTLLGVVGWRSWGEPILPIRPWRIEAREPVGVFRGCLLSLTRRAQPQGTNTWEMGLWRFCRWLFGAWLWTAAGAGTGDSRTPGLISRPTRSRKLIEFPSEPLVRVASVSDLRGSCALEQAPNLLGKSRGAGEGEERGLGLRPGQGRCHSRL